MLFKLLIEEDNAMCPSYSKTYNQVLKLQMGKIYSNAEDKIMHLCLSFAINLNSYNFILLYISSSSLDSIANSSTAKIENNFINISMDTIQFIHFNNLILQKVLY